MVNFRGRRYQGIKLNQAIFITAKNTFLLNYNIELYKKTIYHNREHSQQRKYLEVENKSLAGCFCSKDLANHHDHIATYNVIHQTDVSVSAAATLSDPAARIC